MPKQRQIRWTESDRAELRRLIKNFNQKVRYHRAKNPDADYLPETVTLAELMSHIQTRGDFVRITNHLKAFSKKGAEKVVDTKRGVKMTEWEVGKIKRDMSAYNRAVTKKREQLLKEPVRVAGEDMDYSRVQMEPEGLAKLKPMKRDVRKMSKRELELTLRRIDRQIDPVKAQEDLNRAKNNYIQALQTSELLNIAPELADAVRAMPDDVFYDVISTDEGATFEYLYGSTEAYSKIASLQAAWDAAYARHKKEV